MNIASDPHKKYAKKSGKKGHYYTYKRDKIDDYEEKVNREKERWRKIYADHKEELLALQKKYRDEHPEEMRTRALDMIAKRDPNHLENIRKKTVELSTIAKECCYKINPKIKMEDKERAIEYFKKLKETRDKIRSEREKSL